MLEFLFNKVQVFSCEYCQIFKNSFFYRTPPVAAFHTLNSSSEMKSFSRLTIIWVSFRPFHKLPSRYLLAQSKHWKQQNNVRNLFQVKKRDTRTTYMTNFTHYSGVSIVEFEQKNAGWALNLFMKLNL